MPDADEMYLMVWNSQTQSGLVIRIEVTTTATLVEVVTWSVKVSYFCTEVHKCWGLAHMYHCALLEMAAVGDRVHLTVSFVGLDEAYWQR